MSQERSGWFQRGWSGISRFLARDVWSPETGTTRLPRRGLYRLGRVVFLTSKGIEENKLLMRAGSLTFITVLSIVPLLAFAFSVAKGLGAYDALQTEVIQPFLNQTLGAADGADAAGRELREGIDTLFAFVENTKVSSLGVFGLLVLLYTVLKLLSSIERTFNDIWGVRRSRTFIRKVADYLSICIVVPILLVAATAVSTALQNPEVIGSVRERFGLDALFGFYARCSSLIAVWLGFTFIYLFMPNTRVRVRSALLGGLVGGSIWQLAQVLHVRFQLGVANYNAIYSTFAALPIFLLWLYTSWATVLLGAEVAYAHQVEPIHRELRRVREHDPRTLEILAVRVATRVARCFLRGSALPGIRALAEELEVPEGTIEEVVDPLVAHGLIVRGEESDTDQPLTLARTPERIRVLDLIDAITGREALPATTNADPLDRVITENLSQLEAQHRASAYNCSLTRLVEEAEQEGGGAAEVAPQKGLQPAPEA